MTKWKSILFWCTVAAFAILGAVMSFVFRAYVFSGLLCFGIVGVLLCYRLLCHFYRKKPVLVKTFAIVLTVILGTGVLAAAVTGGFILHTALSQPTPGQQYLIVLGCGVNGTTPSMSLQDRIDGAYAYLTENPETICIVSGGQGGGEDITEAECMFRELTAMGIAPERIWQEDRSTSTQENLLFSLAVIEEKTGSRPKAVGITSSEYHLFRAGLIAESLGLDAVPVAAQTRRFSLAVNYFLREIAAVWYYALFIL